MKQPLPAEVMDRIIDFLYDCRPALRACSLVSPSWLPAAQFHLFNQTHLRRAITAGNTRIANVIISHPDFKPNGGGDVGETWLSLAVRYERRDIVARLLAYPDIDVRAGNPLWWVKHPDTAALLLAHKNADVNRPENGYGCNALVRAAWWGKTAIVARLLTHPDVDVNIRDWRGRTALWYAVSEGHTKTAALLLAHRGVEVEDQIREMKGWRLIWCRAKMRL